MKITNLDSLNSEDQKIILDGKEWLIPGELPVDVVLQLIGLQQEIGEKPTDFDLWEKQYNIILNIFQKRQPELTFSELKDMITARQTGALLAVFMNSLGQAEMSEEEKKTVFMDTEQKDDLISEAKTELST